MPPLPAGNARAAAALSTEGAATAGTGEAAAAALGAEGPAPADGAGAGAAGVAVSSTATWPESTSSQLTWTGDGDPAESTARTTPFPANGLAASARTFGGFGTAGTNGRTGFPSGSPSAGPWSRFHHPLCVGALRVSDAARADATGPTASSSPRKTACGRARPDMHQ